MGTKAAIALFTALFVRPGDAVNAIDRSVQQDVATAIPVPLVNFQVQAPPALPRSAKQCTVELVHNLFANSYYNPAVIEYSPPTNCGPLGNWAGISLNYTVTSNGTQYDRLSAVTLHNVEVWRTSTAEPTKTGIIWTVLKDVSRYIPLFAKPGTLILDLNNIIDTSIGINGAYDVTLTATFYESSLLHPAAKKANVIIPLSNLSPNQANYFSVPPSFSTNVSFPVNSAEAYAEIYASGNADEEFWYFNAANEYFNDLPSGATYNTGPFREVRLLVDGQLAGVAFPFPVIFTGGILPTLWRPIAAIGAFDQPTYQVDLTPFLPLLADGKNHTITLDVASAETDHSILGNWYLSGSVSVLTDSSSKPTTGSIISYSAPLFATTQTTGVVTPQSDGTNDVNITVSAQHKVDIYSRVTTGSGKTTLVRWTQDLSFSNFESFTQNANTQIVKQTSSGSSLSTHNGVTVVSDKFSYPLNIYYSNIFAGNTSGWYTSVDHTYTRTELPSPLVLGSTTTTHQAGAGTWLNTNSVVTANGKTSQTYTYADFEGNTYTRSVSATNSSITKDNVGGSLSGSWPWPWNFGGANGLKTGAQGTHNGFAGRLIKQRTDGKLDVW